MLTHILEFKVKLWDQGAGTNGKLVPDPYCQIQVLILSVTNIFSGRQGYVVRLLNPETASRTLIKGFVGMISELAFSHRDSNTLACVDEGGNVYIWVIQEENGKLEYPFYYLQYWQAL